MAPSRRRKLPEDAETPGRCLKRIKVMDKNSSDCHETESLAIVCSDGKKLANKLTTESTSDIKAKDEAPKPTRISERLSIKRNRQGDLEEDIQAPAHVQTPTKKQKEGKQTGNKKGKKRKPWALWSARDKMHFYHGLEQYGKDFEAISNRISHAARLRGQPEKDKMQVRYFYYRCWGKISKFINMNERGVKAVTQELYGLINYGVLQKYVKENDPQFGRCLNEMIHFGETVYYTPKAKGKKMRTGKLRTPRCVCLKKLNKIEEKSVDVNPDSSKLPYNITVELTPKSYEAWAKVQTMSQNPRVRFKMTANRTLESMFKYLEKKWKPHRVKMKEALGGLDDRNQELVCYLHPKSKIDPVTLIPQEQPKKDVTFNSYRENILPTLLKKKKSRGNKDPDKGKDEANKLIEPHDPSSNEIPNADTNVSSSIDSADQAQGQSASAYKNGLDKLSTFSAMQMPTGKELTPFTSSEVSSVTPIAMKDTLADTPVGSKPPALLLADENAMFPDPSPFSSEDSTSTCSTDASSKQSVINSEPSTVAVTAALTPSGKKKNSKSSKKAIVQTLKGGTVDCDTQPNGDNSSSPTKTDCARSNNDLKDETEHEIARLTELSESGFTLQNTSNVTLLHLSLMLRRESHIRLEYEWRPKKKPKQPPPPGLCQESNIISNLLRRLCNIATLEFTDYTKKPAFVDQAKQASKPPAPCIQCESTRASIARSVKEKRDSLKDSATMTDPIKVFQQSMTPVQLLHPAPVMAGAPKTFVGGTPGIQNVQVNGQESVFRVPLVPGFKNGPSKEEQQQVAKIMQTDKRSKLLRRRTLPKKKSSPIIVQRSLLPKVDPSQMVAYLTPGSQSLPGQVMLGLQPNNLIKVSQSTVSTVAAAGPRSSESNIQEKEIDQCCSEHSGDILALAAKSAEISEDLSNNSPENIIQFTEISPFQDISTSKPETNNLSIISEPITNPVSETTVSSFANTIDLVCGRPTTSLSQMECEPALDTQADVSISDLDISLSAVSNMGPDAGDKFLDMVGLLDNSEQGFSGLIQSPAKKSGSLALENAPLQPQPIVGSRDFDSSILRTPPHAGITSTELNTPSNRAIQLFPSPLKLSIPDQSWEGDVSLSSILGDSSSFSKKRAEKSHEKSNLSCDNNSFTPFFDTSSTDAFDSSSLAFGKSSQISDLSLGSLIDAAGFSKKVIIPSSISPLPTTESCEISKSAQSEPSLSATASTAQLFSEGSQDSIVKLDVDSALQEINEGSMDLVSKFESLAAQISARQEQETVITNPNEKLEKIATVVAGHVPGD